MIHLSKFYLFTLYTDYQFIIFYFLFNTKSDTLPIKPEPIFDHYH